MYTRTKNMSPGNWYDPEAIHFPAKEKMLLKWFLFVFCFFVFLPFRSLSGRNRRGNNYCTVPCYSIQISSYFVPYKCHIRCGSCKIFTISQESKTVSIPLPDWGATLKPWGDLILLTALVLFAASCSVLLIAIDLVRRLHKFKPPRKMRFDFVWIKLEEKIQTLIRVRSSEVFPVCAVE